MTYPELEAMPMAELAALFAEFERRPVPMTWADMGPIIEERRIELHENTVHGGWSAYHRASKILMHGDTALEAAARCYLAGKCMARFSVGVCG
jgi:iron uptake system EfeUOB component EfeO/EfeM